MAPLPFEFSVVAFEIRCAWEEGRREDAKRLVDEHLEHLVSTGKPLSKQFLEIVRRMWLHPEKTERGAKPPKHWLDVGGGYKDYLFDVDYKPGGPGPTKSPAAKKSRGVAARKAMSEKYGLNDPAITTAIEYYEAAVEEHDRVTELHLALVGEAQRYEHWRRHMIAGLNFEHGGLVRVAQRYEHWRWHMIADLNFEHGALLVREEQRYYEHWRRQRVREAQRYEHWRRHMIADLNFEHGRADKWADAAMIVGD